MNPLDQWKNNDAHEKELTEDEDNILNQLGLFGESRRKFLGKISAASLSIFAAPFFTADVFGKATENNIPLDPEALLNEIQVKLRVNNAVNPLSIDSRTTLLDDITPPPAPIAERAAFWDARFGSEVYTYGTAPNAFIAAEAQHLPEGASVLDLGAGEGRNAVFLAQQGFQVTALDYAEAGLEKARTLAEERGVSIETLNADLGSWTPDRQWEVIVCTFVHLRLGERVRLFTAIQAALRPGGILVAEWFRPEQRTDGYTSGGPPTLDLLIKPRELRQHFIWGDIIRCEPAEVTLNEGPFHQGPAATVRFIFRKGNF